MINNEVCEVAMNKIHRQNHYRIYQMEYDNDEMGSTLLINYDFLGIAITYFGYLLLLISALWLVFKRIGWRNFLTLSAVTFGVWFFISQIKPMTPILRSPMLALHVSVIMVSYFLLLLITIFAAIALINKKSADRLYKISTKMLCPALFLLAIGIFLGAVWANISWGRYWGWDSKETWALITLLIYAVPMHKGSFGAFTRPKFFHTYCFLAILAVLMTFLGVNFVLGGLHSYL
jgi:ABC-type transport system involved in cytochrome c biogenesis permease subunit